MGAQRKLIRWMEIQKWSQRELARRLGVSQTNVCRWIAGSHRPRWGTVRRIEGLTEGFVTASDWVEAPIAATPETMAQA